MKSWKIRFCLKKRQQPLLRIKLLAGFKVVWNLAQEPWAGVLFWRIPVLLPCKTLNLKVKFRESFRPFAPSVLAEDVSDWFEQETPSPYMLIVADVHEKRRYKMTDEEKNLFGIDKLNVSRSEIPAITHVDYSARIQTVHKETNPRYHALISAFKEKTGCPVVVNTSFNVRGEPIVNTPHDAFKCFMGTDIEVLVIGNCFLRKDAQDPALAVSYENKYDLD